MKSKFSEFICSLDSEGESSQPSQPSFDAFLKRLGAALRGEVRRRGLWDRPPRYLGVVGRKWADEDAFEELLADCLLFIVKRLRSLLRQSQEGSNIDGLIVLDIRHFLHTAQQKNDPVGSRVYEVLVSAVKRSMNDDKLHLLASDTEGVGEGRKEKTGAKIGRSSVLCFTPRPDFRPDVRVDLIQRVEAWSSYLFPDLVTAWHTSGVVARLEACICRLQDEGVEAFRFGDLMDCLRDNVRGWLGTVRLVSAGPLAREDTDHDLAMIVQMVFPDREFEDRQSFRKMRSCVIQRLESLEESLGTQDYLLKLWLFLLSYAAESSEIGDEDKPPSALKLSQILSIPRNRILGLKETLGRLVRHCQDAISGKVPVRSIEEESADFGPPLPSPSYARQERSTDMSQKSRLERLRLQMGEAVDRFAEDRAHAESQKRWPPRLGDTFIFKQTADVPIEWAAIEQDPANPRRLLVVPADDRPFIGSRDVELSSEAAGGLTSIRCGLGVWLDEQTLDSELRTGVLDLGMVSQVWQKRRKIESGALAGSLLEQEVDGDPEYQEWMERLAGAREFLNERAVAEVREVTEQPRWASVNSLLPLAASILLVVSLGLIGTRYQKIATLESGLKGQEPQLDLPFRHFTGMESVRGSEKPLRVPAAAKRIALILEVTEPEPYPLYRLEILEEDTRREIWVSDHLTRTGSELSLDLPSVLFPAGSYRLRVYGLGGAEAEFLEEYPLAIEIE
ncbi:MAG: hypothetical protein GY719_31330 [bacterium]|nr:hypothetical protein [bacterium]